MSIATQPHRQVPGLDLTKRMPGAGEVPDNLVDITSPDISTISRSTQIED
jgi:hypothetical protein